VNHIEANILTDFSFLSFFFSGTGGLVLGKQVLYYLSCTPVHFSLVILEMGVSQSACLDWYPTAIFPISACLIAKIAGVSHYSFDIKLACNS
jgi:hypothetical protein